MKKYSIILLLLIAGITKAQDSLSISNSNLNFNQQALFFYDDSLGYDYDIETTGADLSENIVTRVTVRNDVNHERVDSVVVGHTYPSVVSYGSWNRVNNGVFLRSAVFKNGNNTVVIWPENVGNTKYSKDSLKFVVSISGHYSTEKVDLFEKLNVQTNQGEIFLDNKVSSDFEVNVFDIGGKLISKVNIERFDNKSIQVKNGVYFITLFDKGVYYRHKVLVRK